MMRVSLIAVGLLFAWSQSSLLTAAVPQDTEAEPVCVQDAEPEPIQKSTALATTIARNLIIRADPREPLVAHLGSNTQSDALQELRQEIQALRQENTALKDRINRLNPGAKLSGIHSQKQLSKSTEEAVQLLLKQTTKAQSETDKRNLEIAVLRAHLDSQEAAKKVRVKSFMLNSQNSDHKNLSERAKLLEKQYKEQINVLEHRADALDAEIQIALNLKDVAQTKAETQRRAQVWFEPKTQSARTPKQPRRVRVSSSNGLLTEVETDGNFWSPGTGSSPRTTIRSTNGIQANGIHVIYSEDGTDKAKTSGQKVTDDHGSGMIIYTQGGEVIFQNSTECQQCKKQSKATSTLGSDVISLFGKDVIKTSSSSSFKPEKLGIFKPGKFGFESLPEGSYSVTTRKGTDQVDSLLDPRELPEAEVPPTSPKTEWTRAKFFVDSLGITEPEDVVIQESSNQDALMAEMKALLSQMERDMQNLSTNLNAVQTAMDHAHKTGSHE